MEEQYLKNVGKSCCEFLNEPATAANDVKKNQIGSHLSKRQEVRAMFNINSE